MSYKCSECGGTFSGTHFCVGKFHGTSAISYNKKKDDQSQEEKLKQTITISLEEYLELKRKAGEP